MNIIFFPDRWGFYTRLTQEPACRPSRTGRGKSAGPAGKETKVTIDIPVGFPFVWSALALASMLMNVDSDLLAAFGD